MREDISKMIISDIFMDFKDILLVGLEENKEQFPYCVACIDFIYELREQGIITTLNSFSEVIRNEIYKECKKYLVR